MRRTPCEIQLQNPGAAHDTPRQWRCERCDREWDESVGPMPHCSGWPVTALENLEAALDLYRERNAVYKDNYKCMGRLLLALFPEGGVPAITSEEDANRLNIIIDCLGKLQRYAFQFAEGGHRDSARDLIVYAAMLEEVTK